MLWFGVNLYVHLHGMLWFAANLYVNLLGMHALQRLPEVPGSAKRENLALAFVRTPISTINQAGPLQKLPEALEDLWEPLGDPLGTSGIFWRGPAWLIVEMGVLTNARAKCSRL